MSGPANCCSSSFAWVIFGSVWLVGLLSGITIGLRWENAKWVEWLNRRGRA